MRGQRSIGKRLAIPPRLTSTSFSSAESLRRRSSSARRFAADRGDRCDRNEVGQVGHRHARRGAQEGIGVGVATDRICAAMSSSPQIMAIDIRPVQRTQRGIRNARPLRTRQRQVADVGKYQVGTEFAQQMRLIGDAPIPVRMEGAIGRAAFLDTARPAPKTSPCRYRLRWADRVNGASMRERRWASGTAERTVRRSSARSWCKPVQDGCGLRDMAETVAGYADNEVRGVAHQFWIV